MKNFAALTVLLFAAASAHAQSDEAPVVQECKVDLMKITEVHSVQPAKGMDEASKTLVKEAVKLAITQGSAQLLGKVTAAQATSTAAKTSSYALGMESYKKFLGAGLDLGLPILIDAVDEVVSGQDDLVIRVSGKRVTRYPFLPMEKSQRAGALQVDTPVSFFQAANIQLIEYDSGSVNDDLGTFQVVDALELVNPFGEQSNQDTVIVLAADEEDGSVYEVSYELTPNAGDLNDIPERLFCNTDECVDASEPFPNDIYIYPRPSVADLKACPQGYRYAGNHFVDATVGNSSFRICELQHDCGDNFQPVRGSEYFEAVHDFQDGDIIALKTRIASTVSMPFGLELYMGNSNGEGYLARCENCFPGSVYSGNTAVHAINPSRDIAQWTVRKLANGKIALQADNGKFLARCNGCVADSAATDHAFTHRNNADADWAQFTIGYSPTSEGEYKYTLQSDVGTYLGTCLNCEDQDDETRLGLRYSTTFHITDPNSDFVKWAIEKRTPRTTELRSDFSGDTVIPEGDIFVIPAGQTVRLPVNATLTVKDGARLINRGTLWVEGHLNVGPLGQFRNTGFVSGGYPYTATGIIRTTGGAENSGLIYNLYGGIIDLSHLRRLVNDGRVYNDGKIYDPWNKFWGSAPDRAWEPELFQPIKALLLTQKNFGYSCMRVLGGMRPQTGLEEGNDVCVVNNYWLRDFNSLVIDEGMTLLIEDGEFNSDGAIENNGTIDNSAGMLRQCHPDGITGPGTTTDPVLACEATPAEAECSSHGGTFERSMQLCTIGYAVASNQNYDKTIRVHSGSRWIINGQLQEYGRVLVEENADLDIIGGVLWTDSLVNYGRILVTADSDGFVGHLQPDGRAVNFGEIVDQGNIIGNGYVVNQCGAVYEPAQHGWSPNGVPYGYWVQGRDFYYNNVSFEECPPVDMDADGVEDSMDLFPLDPAESMDTDLDGVGDNADAFPEDPTETADSDGDGVGDNEDAFPEDVLESRDSDGDGVGDNSDAFPNDARESRDSDLDGVGDIQDALPNDPTESSDQDGDGTGDNSDAFPNDGKNTRLISVSADNNWAPGHAIFKDSTAGFGSLPGGITLPHGMVDFTLTGGDSGSETLLTITYPDPVDPDSVWLKFGRTPQNEALHWYPVHSLDISGSTVTLSLTDGGLGDDDLLANGVIVDPGGPALLAGPITIVASDDTAMVPGVLPTTGQFTVDNGRFTVDLGAPNDTGGPMTVNYMVGGTATAVTDYGQLNGSLVFEEGQQTATIDLTVYSTAQVSDTESVVVTLTDTDIPVWGVDLTPAQVTIKALPAAPEKADEPRSGGGGAMGLWLAPLLLGLGRRKVQAGNRDETAR